jgi:hypothetical protein
MVAASHKLAGAVDTATFTPVRIPGSSPIVDALSGGRGQEQVVEVVTEHANRFGLRFFAQALSISTSRCAII